MAPNDVQRATIRKSVIPKIVQGTRKRELAERYASVESTFPYRADTLRDGEHSEISMFIERTCTNRSDGGGDGDRNNARTLGIATIVESVITDVCQAFRQDDGGERRDIVVPRCTAVGIEGVIVHCTRTLNSQHTGTFQLPCQVIATASACYSVVLGHSCYPCYLCYAQ